MLSAARSWRCRSKRIWSRCPSVRFRSLRGRDLEFTWGKAPAVNGKPLDYEAWPLFGGPFVEAAVDSERLVLKHGNMRRTLDFRALTVHDE